MTKRLEDVLKRLTPEQVEQLTRYAESFPAAVKSSSQPSAPKPSFSWIGSMKDGPYRSGLEAQEAAKHIRIFLLERGLSK